MSAYEIPSLRFSALSGAAVANRRFVKLDSYEKAIQATAGSSAIGVSTVDATAVNQVLEIADGIVIVEAGAAVAIMDSVQSDANGKAIPRTTGQILGTALTAASATGELIAVKMPSVSQTGNVLVLSLPVSNLAAGADLADVPVFVVPAGYKLTVLAASLISQGTAAGIDDSNTCVIALEEGANGIATKTYDADPAFPASGVADSLGAITNPTLTAGEILTYSVTNGATADPPAFIIQVTAILETA